MKEFSSILKRTDSPAFRAECFSSFLFFLFFNKKKLLVAVLTFIFVVRDWIIVISSQKGYRLLSYVSPQRKYYKRNGLTGRQKSLSRPDFSFRSSLKHRNTDPRNIIVTCKLLPLKRPTIQQFFQFRFVRGNFFLII